MADPLEYSCKNCYEGFNDSTRKPVILDCSKKCASLCSKCYVSYQKNQQCETICATCQTQFTSNRAVETLPVNLTLIKKAMIANENFMITVVYNMKNIFIEDLSKNDTLMKLQTKVGELTKIAVKDQNLTFEGEPLIEKEKTLSLGDIGISSNVTLNLVKYNEGGWS